MKTINHEIKLETSVKVIMSILAVGILLNSFSTPIAMELFGIKEVLADMTSLSGTISVVCSGCN